MDLPELKNQGGSAYAPPPGPPPSPESVATTIAQNRGATTSLALPSSSVPSSTLSRTASNHSLSTSFPPTPPTVSRPSRPSRSEDERIIETRQPPKDRSYDPTFSRGEWIQALQVPAVRWTIAYQASFSATPALFAWATSTRARNNQTLSTGLFAASIVLLSASYVFKICAIHTNNLRRATLTSDVELGLFEEVVFWEDNTSLKTDRGIEDLRNSVRNQVNEGLQRAYSLSNSVCEMELKMYDSSASAFFYGVSSIASGAAVGKYATIGGSVALMSISTIIIAVRNGAIKKRYELMKDSEYANYARNADNSIRLLWRPLASSNATSLSSAEDEVKGLGIKKKERARAEALDSKSNLVLPLVPLCANFVALLVVAFRKREVSFFQSPELAAGLAILGSTAAASFSLYDTITLVRQAPLVYKNRGEICKLPAAINVDVQIKYKDLKASEQQERDAVEERRVLQQRLSAVGTQART